MDLTIEAVLLDKARIILLPQQGEAELLENIGRTIQFNLDLGTTYLIEFQRPGCVSRQLLVDTRVPGNAAVTSLIALAKMKLVVPKRGQDFEFSGPVGYIYFNEAAGAFLYHTDYRVVGERSMVDRMNVERKQFALPDALVVVPKRGYITHPDYEYGTKVANGVNNEPLVHLTGRERSEDHFRQNVEVASIVTLVAQPVAPVETPVAAATLQVASHVAPIAPVEAPAFISASVIAEPLINEELTVSRLRIIKDVKVLRDGRTETYRKVTERYGAVYYFKDGVSCSEHVYQYGIAPLVQPALPCDQVSCRR